jgi:rod shape-determining protein MreC
VAAPPIPSRRLVVLLVITAVALMTIDVRGLGPLDRARELTLTLTRPARDVVAWAAAPVVEGWRGAVHYDDLQEENAQLRARVAELQGLVDRAPDAEAELAALLRASDLSFAGDVERVVTRVAVDRRSGLERVVELDKGSDDGVRAGMPVVTGTGLVGRLELVTPRRSVVRIVTDPTFDVGVRSSSGELGVASGDGAEQPLVLELASPGSTGEPGQRYATAGSEGSVFPPGIPVGQVTGEVPGDATLRLEPLAELAQLHYVTVLLWEPDR